MSAVPPRAVVVTRPTAYEALLARNSTRGQAAFILEGRGQALGPVEAQHAAFAAARTAVLGAIPAAWRRAAVDRADLPRFLFGPDDVVVALGPDGLVANVAKYLDGQPVLGVNPDPEHVEGALVRLRAEQVGRLLPRAAAGDVGVEERTMVEAVRDDGVRLLALNEVFIGHVSHQSARYLLRCPAGEERQSSSGILVCTGTGATGWARSIVAERAASPPLPAPADRRLVHFTREAWPSVASGASLTAGTLVEGQALEVVSELDEGGVVFGDGIESDRLELSWGRTARVAVATRRLRLVLG